MNEGVPKFPRGEHFKKPEEFDFHRQRFEQADASRNPLYSLFGLLDHPDITHAEYAEAARENKDIDKRAHEEFTDESFPQSYKQLQFVMERIREKSRNPEAGVRAVLVGMGAGMAVAHGVGDVLGFNDVGVTAETFDALYGISASVPLLMYYAAGPEETKRGATMFMTRLADKRFINPLKQPRIVNLDYLKKEMDSGTYALDEAKVRAARPRIKVIVTPATEPGVQPKAEILDVKDPNIFPQMSDAAKVGMSIDGITARTKDIPTIDGKQYRDGGFDPMPVEKVIDDYTKDHGVPPTDVLILANRPFEAMDDMKPGIATKIGVQAMKNRLMTPLDKFLMIREQVRQSLLYIQNVKERTGVNVAIVWPRDMGIETTDINGPKMTAAALEAMRDVYALCGEEQPEKLPWDPAGVVERARTSANELAKQKNSVE